MTTPNITDDEREQIKCALWHYHRSKYHRITDYNKVINNREEIEEGVFYYPCPLQDVYLDDTFYAVTHDRQFVNTLYFTEDNEIIMDGDVPAQDLPEGSYDHVESTVYYDFRDERPEVEPGYTGDTSMANVYVRLGSREWKRSDSGGGGVRG